MRLPRRIAPFFERRDVAAMRLSFGQEMRQAQVQKQILAPRMIQSMEILQLPIQALEERIEQELQENPILEMRENDPEMPEERLDMDAPDAKTDEERELVISEGSNNEDDFERLSKLDKEEYPDTFDEDFRPSSNRIQEMGDRKHDAMANMESRPQTLQDYVLDQLTWFDLTPAVREATERIVYNLDANGFLPMGLDDLIGFHVEKREEMLAAAQEALQAIQSLDPRGLGARDIRECLLLQLTAGMPFYEELKKLIEEHLEDLEHNRLPVIAKSLGVSLTELQEILNELRRLNPKPGAEFNTTTAPSVTPDLFVDRNEDGSYTVRMEDGRTPSLYVSPYYRRLIAKGDATRETKEYINKKLGAAEWLIQSIEQRRNTLSRVAQAIVDHQTRFFEEGPEFIEPLKMQQIADKVGVHVTTVSRAVDDKWIQTHRGIFSLKRFFVGGTSSGDGEQVAWDVVRIKLQEIVDNEDKKKPLSDEAIVKLLTDQGFDVKRRTVTKYRKEMNIPSSRERKQWT